MIINFNGLGEALWAGSPNRTHENVTERATGPLQNLVFE